MATRQLKTEVEEEVKSKPMGKKGKEPKTEEKKKGRELKKEEEESKPTWNDSEQEEEIKANASRQGVVLNEEEIKVLVLNVWGAGPTAARYVLVPRLVEENNPDCSCKRLKLMK